MRGRAGAWRRCRRSGRSSCRSRSRGSRGPPGVFIAGLNPHRRRRTPSSRASCRSSSDRSPPALANAQAYVNERLRAEALAQIDRAKTAFFSNVSHELRTPLTLILGPVADALRSGRRALDHEALELVHRNGCPAAEAGERAARLLAHRGGPHGRQLRADRPRRATRRNSPAPSARWSKARGCGSSSSSPVRGEAVYVDRDMWEKIVLNLLSNAFKFTLAGEIRVSRRA